MTIFQHETMSYFIMVLEFKRCVKVCDPRDAIECPPCYGAYNCAPSGTCAPSLIKVNTCGEVCNVFSVKCDKAYYKLKKICYENTPGKAVTIYKKLDLVFNLLDIYKMTFTIYPCGCPMVPLTIDLQVLAGSEGLNIVTTPGPNSITIEAEIPVISISPTPVCSVILKALNWLVKLKLRESRLRCQMDLLSKRDNQTKIRYIPSCPSSLYLLPPTPFPAPGENPLLPVQSPFPGAVFPWTQALIPWKKNQPFPAGPPVSPLVNGLNEAYNKFRSVPDSVIFYLGYDAADVSPTQSEWTLFLRNFADRGYAQTAPEGWTWP